MKRCSADTSMTTLPVCWGAATDKGKVRDENEDAFVIEPELALFLVSDGMGGHRGGALASKIVVDDLPVMVETKLDRLKSSSPRAVRSLLRKTIIEQNEQLQMEGASEAGYKDMGATLVMVLIRNTRAYLANLGDSRIYRLRKNRLAQLSKDHSVICKLLDDGRIRPADAEDHPEQGQITRYIGMEERAAPHIRSFILKPGDRLLLCTDGLTDMLDDRSIAAILIAGPDPQTASEALVNAANAAGGHDNITAIVIDWAG